MNFATCLSPTSSITVNPLKTDSNVIALKAFEEIIRTSIGPNGKLKIVQNIVGGHVTVTSSSLRLLNIVSIKNTFLKMISASTKAHLSNFGDSGLCCTFLTLKLINNSLSLSYPSPMIGKLFECFGKMFVDCLNIENNCVMKTDLSNLANFESVVHSVLQSKPGCILRQEDKKHMSLLLIKAYLNCIPSTISAVYHKNLNVITLEGTNCLESCLFEGLLIKSSELPLITLPYLLNMPVIKIVLFTTSLSGDIEFPVDSIEVTNNVSIWETVLKFLKSTIQNIIKAGVHILACQKVVHPSLRKQLEDANILVLDRLGYETSKSLEYLSGASNSSLFNDVSFGYLTCISKNTIGKKDFLLLSNSSKPFWTLLICNFNEEAVNETKVVCQQAIDSLFQLLKKPLVCFGAGCTEIHTSRLVEQKVSETIDDIKGEIGCSTSQGLETLKIFLQSIADLVISIHQGSRLNFVTETVFGHLWKLNEGNFPSAVDRCLCGQFSAIDIKDSDWKFLTKLGTHESDVTVFRPVKDLEKIDRSVILDELSSKVNAYSFAFETASLLLRVSLSISN